VVCFLSGSTVRPLIILFAKVPVPGRVKTRLVPPLDYASAADLHSACVRDMVERLSRHDLELCTDAPSSPWPDLRIPHSTQAAGDLGSRLIRTFEAALSAGRPVVVVVGSDAPALPPAHVETLLASSADVTLGPAEDGGFWGIACRRVHHAMFADVEWSQPDTLSRTVGAVRRQGLTVDLGAEWWDVDEPADLWRLRWAPVGRHIQAWLAANTASHLRDQSAL
jgi:rSAM/selenodomain-associated transferase 1